MEYKTIHDWLGIVQEMEIWLVGFKGISTSIGYLMPEPFYIYIIYMICKRIFLGRWWLGFMAN